MVNEPDHILFNELLDPLCNIQLCITTQIVEKKTGLQEDARERIDEARVTAGKRRIFCHISTAGSRMTDDTEDVECSGR